MPRAGARAAAASYSQLTDYARCGYRFYLDARAGLPRVTPPGEIAPPPPPNPPRRRGWASRRRWTSSGPRLTRPRAARGARLRPPGRPPTPTVAGARRGPGLELDARTGRRPPAAGRGVRRLAVVRPARGGARVRREAGFAFALEPDGGGPLLRASSTSSRARRTAGADRRRQDRPARRGDAGGPCRRAYAHAAHGLRARRAAGRRAARRGRLLRCSSGPPSRSPARSARRRAALADALSRLAAGSSTSAGRSPPSRTATSAATARAGHRCPRGRSG